MRNILKIEFNEICYRPANVIMIIIMIDGSLNLNVSKIICDGHTIRLNDSVLRFYYREKRVRISCLEVREKSFSQRR